MAAPTNVDRSGTAGRSATALGDDDITRLRFVLLRLSRRLRQESTAGITPSQLSALSIIGGMGPLTIGELAEVEQVQPPTMSRIVAALEIDGWVERIADRTDRRVSFVQVSPKGREELERVRTERNELLAARLHNLDPDEAATIVAALPALEHLLQDGE
jgi:DNA-binding MarR family transcriptional regulator